MYRRLRERRISFRNLKKRGTQRARTEALAMRRAEERARRQERRVRLGSRRPRVLHSEVEVLMAELCLLDPRAAVWCAARCARTTLSLIVDSTAWPRAPGGALVAARAVALAEAWSCPESAVLPSRLIPEGAGGRASRQQCKEAALAASALVSRYYASGAPAAMRAAARAANAAARPGDAVLAVASAVRAHRMAAWWAASRRPEAERQRSRAPKVPGQVLALLRAQRWPATVPSLARIRAADGPVAVAWDRLAGVTPEHTVVELFELRARAERLGLRWDDPVERAVAERAVDEDEVRALLGPRARPG